jgi:ABC-type nitrate/sulfonate/bicarbonate transport system ATPase subunit
MTDPEIVIDKVSKVYKAASSDPVFALEETTLKVAPGKFVCILGPSGCGKSTLLSMVAGLIRPSSGAIRVGGAPVSGPGPERGLVFQQYGLFPCRGVSREDREATVDKYIRLMGLSGFENRYPSELSGGMKQRVAIGRTLANNPRVLLMDEPFGAVDALTRELLQDEILRLWEIEQKTILFVTHSMMEAAYLADEIVMLRSRPGRVFATVTVPLERPRSRSDLEFLRFYSEAEETFKMEIVKDAASGDPREKILGSPQ